MSRIEECALRLCTHKRCVFTATLRQVNVQVQGRTGCEAGADRTGDSKAPRSPEPRQMVRRASGFGCAVIVLRIGEPEIA